MSDTPNTPVTPAAPPPAAPAAPAAAANTPSWTEGMADDLKGYVELKQFKDPASLVDSYRNLEKLTGAPKERLLKLPEKEDAPEWGEIYGRLGRPAKPEEYKLPLPQGADPEFAKQASSWFHEAGISQKQAEKITAKWNEFVGNTQATQQAAGHEAMAAQDKELQKEWGAAYAKNNMIVDNVAKKFNIDDATLKQLGASMGYQKAMKFLHSLGEGLGEANFITGSGNQNFGGQMTPTAAMARISELRGDTAFVAKYAAGDASAKAEMERLHKMAYPDPVQ